MGGKCNYGPDLGPLTLSLSRQGRGNLMPSGQRVSERNNDFHSRAYRPLGIILMSRGIPKVNQQPVAKILCDVPVIAADHFSACRLIRPHHLAPFFRIKLLGERGRAYQVAEHDGELAAFPVTASRVFQFRV
jgi:hypothetical protein